MASASIEKATTSASDSRVCSSTTWRILIVRPALVTFELVIHNAHT